MTNRVRRSSSQRLEGYSELLLLGDRAEPCRAISGANASLQPSEVIRSVTQFVCSRRSENIPAEVVNVDWLAAA